MAALDPGSPASSPGAIRVSASAADGMATAVVDGTGRLVDLTLTAVVESYRFGINVGPPSRDPTSGVITTGRIGMYGGIQ